MGVANSVELKRRWDIRNLQRAMFGTSFPEDLSDLLDDAQDDERKAPDSTPDKNQLHPYSNPIYGMYRYESTKQREHTSLALQTCPKVESNAHTATDPQCPIVDSIHRKKRNILSPINTD